MGFPMDEANDWSTEGRNILSADRLTAIREILENVGPAIVEHWFYYGSCSPERLVFDDYDKLLECLTANARPGDKFCLWNFAKVCRDDNTLANGKYPDAQDRVPKGGAY